MCRLMMLSLILWLALPVVAQQNHQHLKETFQHRLDSLLTPVGVPGMTFGVVFGEGDYINLSTGVDDLESPQPLKPSARMFGGSTGKIWVAAIALKLIEEGRLGLDDLVAKHLGSTPWYGDIPNGQDITVRNLLNHTTGIPRHVMKPALWEQIHADPDAYPGKVECVSVIAGDAPLFAAGEGWGYADTNYIILGLVIEKVSSEKYEDLVVNRIIKPFKLSLTGIQNSREIKDLPSGYTGEGAPFNLPAKVPVDDKYPIHPMFEWEGGGLVGNVLDMARWARIYWGGQWLNEAMQAEMIKPVHLRTGQPADQGWGLGLHSFDWDGVRVLNHGGIFPGYETIVAYFPDWGIGAAVQMNADRLSGKQKMPPMAVLLEMMKIVKNQMPAH